MHFGAISMEERGRFAKYCSAQKGRSKIKSWATNSKKPQEIVRDDALPLINLPDLDRARIDVQAAKASLRAVFVAGQDP